MKWKGRDGKWYDDLNDCVAADNRYKQQDQQNALIFEQNQLIQRQMADRELMEMEREEHELNMAKEERANQLFDAIGISKKEFFGFKNKFLFVDLAVDLRKEKDVLDIELAKLERIYNGPLDIISSAIKNNKLVLNDIEKLKVLDINEEFISYKAFRIAAYILYALPFAVLIFLYMFFSDTSSDTLITIFAVFTIIDFLMAMIVYLLSRKDEKKVIDKLKKYKKNSTAIKQMKKLEEELSNVEEKIKLKDKKSKEILLSNYNEFTLFRKEHYNGEFEKLLLDLNIDEDYKENDIEFIKINNNTKIGDGTIEDYIFFIQQKID